MLLHLFVVDSVVIYLLLLMLLLLLLLLELIIAFVHFLTCICWWWLFIWLMMVFVDDDTIYCWYLLWLTILFVWPLRDIIQWRICDYLQYLLCPFYCCVIISGCPTPHSVWLHSGAICPLMCPLKLTDYVCAWLCVCVCVWLILWPIHHCPCTTTNFVHSTIYIVSSLVLLIHLMLWTSVIAILHCCWLHSDPIDPIVVICSVVIIDDTLLLLTGCYSLILFTLSPMVFHDITVIHCVRHWCIPFDRCYCVCPLQAIVIFVCHVDSDYIVVLIHSLMMTILHTITFWFGIYVLISTMVRCWFHLSHYPHICYSLMVTDRFHSSLFISVFVDDPRWPTPGIVVDDGDATLHTVLSSPVDRYYDAVGIYSGDVPIVVLVSSTGVEYIDDICCWWYIDDTMLSGIRPIWWCYSTMIWRTVSPFWYLIVIDYVL